MSISTLKYSRRRPPSLLMATRPVAAIVRWGQRLPDDEHACTETTVLLGATNGAFERLSTVASCRELEWHSEPLWHSRRGHATSCCTIVTLSAPQASVLPAFAINKSRPRNELASHDPTRSFLPSGR